MLLLLSLPRGCPVSSHLCPSSVSRGAGPAGSGLTSRSLCLAALGIRDPVS